MIATPPIPRFADSSYFVALLSPRDQWHKRASDLTATFGGQIVTTAWVLCEVSASTSSVDNRDRLFLYDERRSDSRVVMIEPSWDWFGRGIDLFRNRPDKEWSLVDCISFLEMEERGLQEALAADHHFEQAGFVVLLQ